MLPHQEIPKMPVQLHITSRLRFGQLLTADGVEFWDMIQYPEIPASLDDVFYQIQGTDRIDLLAHRFYGNSSYWWVIAVANNMDLLPTDFLSADIIRIPSPTYVGGELFVDAVVR